MDARGRASPADVRVLSLCFTAGVLAVFQLSQLPSVAWLAGLAVPACWRWRWRALYASAVFGALLAVLQAQARLDGRWPAERHGEEREVSGHIAGLVEREMVAPDEGPTLRFDFEPDDPALPRRIRAAWYRTGVTPGGGECWRLELRLRTPHGSLDPGASDFEAWLFRQGVGAIATVRDGTRCAESAPGFTLLRWRQAIVEHLRSWMGAGREEAMAAALLVGDESGFTDADWDVFRRTGTSHLVAISGFNVAIAAAIAGVMARMLWSLSLRLPLLVPAQKVGALAAAVAGIVYGLLAGWESPVRRAALMLAVLLLASLAGRASRPSRGLAAVWAVMLALDPAQVLSPGLWLSFGAVAAIFYQASGRISPLRGWRGTLSLQWMLTVMLVPLSLFFFQGTSWIGLPVNLVAVPVVAVLTPALLAAAGLAATAPALGLPALHAVGWSLGAFQSGLAWAAQHTAYAWLPANPPLATLALALAGAVLWFAPRGWPLGLLATACVAVLVAPPVARLRGSFEMTVLDVGQGLSVVIRTARHTLLYDTGPAFENGFDAGESVVAPALLRLGRTRVDRLVLSHPDSDHAGGLRAVRRLLHVDDEVGTPHHAPCTRGAGWEWDGVRFEVLHPGEQDAGRDNDGSCVVRVAAPDLSVLLTGDIEHGAEDHLLAASAPGALRSGVLVAPHHGSKTSSTDELLDAVAPKLAVFSAGWKSRFGHPAREVVARYDARGIAHVTTGDAGAVEIWPQGGELRWEAMRATSRRFWNAAPSP